MKYRARARVRTSRILIVLVTIATYLLLLTVDSLNFFPKNGAETSSLFLPLVRFGFSTFVALMFLAVGSLVWLYARRRGVASLLFCLSFAAMVTFTLETASQDNPLISSIAGASGSLAIALFAILLLLFPRDYLSSSSQSNAIGNEPQLKQHQYVILLLRIYAVGLIFLGTVAALYAILDRLPFWHLPSWLETVDNSYDIVALLGILLTIVISYRQSPSSRERQQRRFFAIGVILAFAPLLVLTVLPSALSLLQPYIVDSQLSTLTFAILPIALGYSILRYQILVFDRHIRRAAAYIAGLVSLALLTYMVIALSTIVFEGNPSAQVICVAIAIAVLGPLSWSATKELMDRLFFSEIAHYQRLIDRPTLLTEETFDVDKAAELLTTATLNVFETSAVCLFVLDQDTGYYQPYPAFKDDEPNDAPRRLLLQRLFQVMKSASFHEGTDWIEAQNPVIRRVKAAKRPLLLSEVSTPEEEAPRGLARYLITTGPLDGADPLLAAVRVQGEMIGLLVLGERSDHQSYAGPDFEAVYLLLARYSSMLENARLYVQRNRHVAILNSINSARTLQGAAFQSLEDAASAYAKIAAEATATGAELWIYDGKTHCLRSLIHAGSGPRITTLEQFSALQEEDWAAWFCQGGGSHTWQGPSSDVPPCLPQTPCFPFIWLPLIEGERRLGVLTLTYPRPHVFAHEEKRVLNMFAIQCATALQNAKMTMDLLMAYESLKELDKMKDRFITTASHELRTPLTAVQGYIELLGDHDFQLSDEQRTAFIANARRGCDELKLMVENIMDASRVQFDVKNVRLRRLVLAESVVHVLEIMTALSETEKRSLQVHVPTSFVVIADDLRLRQVLLNLVSNAFKYSPKGTPVEIVAKADDEYVTVLVRDHGLGVPLGDQGRLFERFVRLERDMNSPARGAGLGLSICRQLVEAMGGRIWIESAGIEGEGSTFIFTLKRPAVEQEQQRVLKRVVLEHQTAL